MVVKALEKREKKSVSSTVRVSKSQDHEYWRVYVFQKLKREKSVTKQQDNIYVKTMNEKERERESLNNLRSLREPFHLKIFPLAFLH